MDPEGITIPEKWFKRKWIALVFVLSFVGMFLLSSVLKTLSERPAFRGCERDLRSQTKLPSNWRIVSCKPGDWSMDFDADVWVPTGQDSNHVVDEFGRLNPRTGAPPDNSLTIEPDLKRSNVYLIKMVNSK